MTMLEPFSLSRLHLEIHEYLMEKGVEFTDRYNLYSIEFTVLGVPYSVWADLLLPTILRLKEEHAPAASQVTARQFGTAGCLDSYSIHFRWTEGKYR